MAPGPRKSDAIDKPDPRAPHIILRTLPALSFSTPTHSIHVQLAFRPPARCKLYPMPETHVETRSRDSFGQPASEKPVTVVSSERPRSIHSVDSSTGIDVAVLDNHVANLLAGSQKTNKHISDLSARLDTHATDTQASLQDHNTRLQELADRQNALSRDIQTSQNNLVARINSAVVQMGSNLTVVQEMIGETIQAVQDDMDEQLGAVDGRLNAIEDRLDTMDGRLDSVDEQLGTINERLNTLETSVNAVNTTLVNLTAAIERLTGTGSTAPRVVVPPSSPGLRLTAPQAPNVPAPDAPTSPNTPASPSSPSSLAPYAPGSPSTPTLRPRSSRASLSGVVKEVVRGARDVLTGGKKGQADRRTRSTERGRTISTTGDEQDLPPVPSLPQAMRREESPVAGPSTHT